MGKNSWRCHQLVTILSLNGITYIHNDDELHHLLAKILKTKNAEIRIRISQDQTSKVATLKATDWALADSAINHATTC